MINTHIHDRIIILLIVFGLFSLGLLAFIVPLICVVKEIPLAFVVQLVLGC